MPGVAWAFVVIWGALAGSALLGPPRAWDGVDPLVNRGHYRPEAAEYRTWTSSPTRRADRSCEFTLFALVTREQLTRLRVNGYEQLLDWSWSWPVTIPNGMRGDGMVVEFIDPVSRRTVATHEVSEVCWEFAP